MGEGGNKTSILSEWIGYPVFITYMSGPNPDANEPSKQVREQPMAATASFLLEDYGPLGIEAKRNRTDPTIFMPWGGVLFVQGPLPEIRKQIDEQMSRHGQGGGQSE